MANYHASGRFHIGVGRISNPQGGPYDLQRPPRGSAVPGHCFAQQGRDQRQQNWQPWRGSRQGHSLQPFGAPPHYQSTMLHATDSRHQHFAYSSISQKRRHGDNQCTSLSPPSHPYTGDAHAERPRGRSAQPLERDYDRLRSEREDGQKVFEGEYKKLQVDSSSKEVGQHNVSRPLGAVSCSTTRSSSGGRCDSRRHAEGQARHRSTISGAEVLTGEDGVLHAAQPKERENEIDPLHEFATAELAVSAAAAGVASQTAADSDIFEMTEAEVRVYAVQMQALTRVLLRNMRCLYSTARAEIDRKDRRIAAQESEIASLKCLLAKPQSGS